MSFEDWSLSAWGRWLPRRGSEPTTEPAEGDPAPAGLGEAIVAIRREREIHALLVAEMARRGPETTADDLYDEVAAAWDRDHQPPSSPGATGATVAAAGEPVSAGTPEWAQQLLDEQRETNRLLGILVERLGMKKPPVE